MRKGPGENKMSNEIRKGKVSGQRRHGRMKRQDEDGGHRKTNREAYGSIGHMDVKTRKKRTRHEKAREVKLGETNRKHREVRRQH